MPQAIDLARVASNEAKVIAGDVLLTIGANGLDSVPPELVEKLASAVVNLSHAIDGICHHLAPLTEYQSALLDVIMAEPERIGSVLNIPPNTGKACMEGCGGSAGKPYKPRGPEQLEQR